MRKNETGQSVSFWEDREFDTQYSKLNGDFETEVCVIGAGIAGLSVAYQLTLEGKDVIVLDDGAVGWGETGRSSAHLSSVIDDRFFELEKIHGKEKLSKVVESHAQAIDTIEEIIKVEGISCDFERVPGLLMLDHDEAPETLYKEMKAARRAGWVNTKIITSPKSSGLKARAYLEFPNQAQFNPIKYLHGLANAIRREDGRIFVRTHAQSFDKTIDRVTVHTDFGHTVRARHLVVATNTPINNLLTLHTKQAAYRTYVLLAKIPKGVISKALYWDMKDPYHYVRTISGTDDHDFVVIGGEDHRTGQEHDGGERFEQLEFWGRSRIPEMGKVEYQWSGQIIETFDGLAFIGRNPGDKQNIYIVSGDSGMGLTHGTIAGNLITDLILGRKNSYQELYDPARVPIRSLLKFTGENLNSVGQYLKWIAPNHLTDLLDIEPGHGALVREGLKLNAVYRDQRGDFHAFSATCPHLGGVVEWNEVENTWDCPCHGSRFSCKGEILNGPANRNLTPRPLMVGTVSETGMTRIENTAQA